MVNQVPRADICLRMTPAEMKMILTALDAYSHNNDYSALVSRIRHQLRADDPRAGDYPRQQARSLAN